MSDLCILNRGEVVNRRLELRADDARVCLACNDTVQDGHGLGVVAASMADGGMSPRGAWICEHCIEDARENRMHAAALGQVVLLLAGRL